MQIDILEEDVITNVIILQTVLEEIRHKSSTVYKKLKNIIADTKRKFFVFINEHHRYMNIYYINESYIYYIQYIYMLIIVCSHLI